MGLWLDGVIAKFSGNTEAMEKAIQGMIDLNQAHLDARDANEVRTHEERMAYTGIVRETMAMQARAIEKFVSPVGPSVETATI